MSRGFALLERLRSEEAGTTIIEVLASAVVLAILSVGVLSGIDSSQNLSNQSRLRSVAASLAQADQERLRGLRARELSNRRETTAKEVRGADLHHQLDFFVALRLDGPSSLRCARGLLAHQVECHLAGHGQPEADRGHESRLSADGVLR